MRHIFKVAVPAISLLFAPLALAAAALPPGVTVAGTVMQIPSDAYGPATIAGETYASSDAAQTKPLANAQVVIGPVPILGATLPPKLPPGDVAVTTTAAGAFSATLPAAPVAPSASRSNFINMVQPTFVLPPDNVTHFTPPASGYFVEVFGVGSDGTSVGKPIPVHRFLPASTSLVLRVTTPTAAEASALAVVNADRAQNGVGTLIFDESAQEAARLHAADQVRNAYSLCHYDRQSIGPVSRYLNVGGIGLVGEALGAELGAPVASAQAFSAIESAFLAQKTQDPPGRHYANLVDPPHLWAGLAAAESANGADVSYELITPPGARESVVGTGGYPVTNGCPTGVAINNS
jgi:uncharacterized protein YkwD